MKKNRMWWIAGLVAGAAALVGGIAAASSGQQNQPQPPVPPPPTPQPPAPQPQPQPAMTCGTAVPDASDPNAVNIANSIVDSDSPAPWVEGGSYTQVVDGVTYQFRMERNGDLKIVSVWRCTS